VPRLNDVCRYVRSKNAGPFWMTIDLFFDGPESYSLYKDDPAIGPAAVAALYGANVTDLRRYCVDDLSVVKISFPRRQPQGGVLERDMHSGQQYVQLLDLDLSPPA